MKIKEVCQRTGLTDKAVRTYINEKLISPDYDENYMGRRTFNFSDKDVEQLKKIVVLRKYNFSLKEIKLLFNAEVSPKELLTSHINVMKADVDADVDIINSMVNVLSEAPENSNELCIMLDTLEIAKKPVPIVDNTAPFRLMNEKLKKRNKKILVTAIILGAAALLLTVFIFSNNFLSSVIFRHSNALVHFNGFCVIESDTAENKLNDIEKNYSLYTDSIVYLENDAEYINVNDVNNRFVLVNAKVSNNKPKLKFKDTVSFDDNYNWDAVKYIIIEAEYQPTKEYYKIIPIVSEDGEAYTDLAFASAWISSNEDFEYKPDNMICSNGVFELDIKVNEKRK